MTGDDTPDIRTAAHMVAHQSNRDLVAALLLMRDYAHGRNQTVGAAARDITADRIHFDSLGQSHRRPIVDPK